jgi:hypothetical protein
VAGHRPSIMARYRIVELPDPRVSGELVYEVHEWEPLAFGFGQWDFVNQFDYIERAEQYVDELLSVHRVVKEYD